MFTFCQCTANIYVYMYMKMHVHSTQAKIVVEDVQCSSVTLSPSLSSQPLTVSVSPHSKPPSRLKPPGRLVRYWESLSWCDTPCTCTCISALSSLHPSLPLPQSLPTSLRPSRPPSLPPSGIRPFCSGDLHRGSQITGSSKSHIQCTVHVAYNHVQNTHVMHSCLLNLLRGNCVYMYTSSYITLYFVPSGCKGSYWQDRWG